VASSIPGLFAPFSLCRARKTGIRGPPGAGGAVHAAMHKACIYTVFATERPFCLFRAWYIVGNRLLIGRKIHGDKRKPAAWQFGFLFFDFLS